MEGADDSQQAPQTTMDDEQPFASGEEEEQEGAAAAAHYPQQYPYQQPQQHAQPYAGHEMRLALASPAAAAAASSSFAALPLGVSGYNAGLPPRSRPVKGASLMTLDETGRLDALSTPKVVTATIAPTVAQIRHIMHTQADRVRLHKHKRQRERRTQRGAEERKRRRSIRSAALFFSSFLVCSAALSSDSHDSNSRKGKGAPHTENRPGQRKIGQRTQHTGSDGGSELAGWLDYLACSHLLSYVSLSSALARPCRLCIRFTETLLPMPQPRRSRLRVTPPLSTVRSKRPSMLRLRIDPRFSPTPVCPRATSRIVCSCWSCSWTKTSRRSSSRP